MLAVSLLNCDNVLDWVYSNNLVNHGMCDSIFRNLGPKAIS